MYPIFLLLFAVLSFCLFQAAAGVGGLVTIMAACFYYIQVFAEGAPTPIFWVLSLLSQPAFAMAIDKVSQTVRNLHFLSKNSTLISRENRRFFG